MKNSKTILIISFVSLFTLSAVPALSDTYRFYEIGPFKLFDDDSNLTFTYCFMKASHSSIYEQLYVATHGSSSANLSKKAVHSAEVGEYCSCSFVLRTSDYLSQSGMDIRLDVKNGYNDTAYFTVSTTIYPTDFMEVNPFELEDMRYDSGTIIFEKMPSKETNVSCVYDFSLLQPYLESDDFLYLNFSNNFFTYTSVADFEYGNAFIEFSDENNLFPYITSNSLGYKCIPLVLAENNGLVELKYANEFYYDPNTMQLSLNWRNSYVKTPYFYFPKNSKDIVEDYVFYVHLIDIGKDKLDVRYPLEYSASRNKFGSCNNSDYCVIGGVKE